MKYRTPISRLTWTLLLCAALPAVAAEPKVGVSLHADVEVVAAASPFQIALRFEIPDGFHIYWENPGESGMAPEVTWSLPEGFTAGSLRFPPPKTHRASGIVTYVLEQSPVLLTTITPPADLAPGASFVAKARIDWLVCKEQCFKQTKELELTLPAGDEAVPTTNEDDVLLFKIATRKMPSADGKGKYATVAAAPTVDRLAQGDHFELVLKVALKDGHHAQSDKPLSEFFVPTEVFLNAVPGLQFGDPVWPEAHLRTDRTLGRVAEFVGEFDVRIPVTVTAPTEASDVTLRGLLRYQACTDAGRCFPPEAVAWSSAVLRSETVRTAGVDEGDAPPAAAPRVIDPSITGPGDVAAKTNDLPVTGLLGAIFGGLLGGLILNIMPCVLPVISIKILSFVQQANEDPRRVFRLGLVFSLGIVISFWILAGGILALQYSTQSTRGWGAFFQEPPFVVGMIVVMFVFAMNLFGVFEIMLPGATAGKLAGAADREGYTGAFFKGVLATLLATPCTAPFLASAISFALNSNPVIVFVIFTSAGVGMALPYLLLTARPAWMKYLPKPGTWMVTFKQFMGFLLIGTAVWLLWVLGKLTGESGVVAMVAGMAFLGLATWLYGRVEFTWSTGAKLVTYVAVLGIVASGAAAGSWLYESPAEASAVAAVQWAPFEKGLAENLAARGKTVYVDYTAAWCLTCQANKKLVFTNSRVLGKLETLGVVLIKADFTNYDEDIAGDLKRFNRDAVPLNVIYPANRPDAPIVLPVALTPGRVVDALEQAGPSSTSS